MRVAKLRIINMQITVLNAIKAPGANDPIAESESLREFVELLQTTPLPEGDEVDTRPFDGDEIFFCVSAIDP